MYQAIDPQTRGQQDPLAQLQDIHLPSAIGIWPPAWGWWVLFVLVIAVAAAIIFFVQRRKSRNAYRELALRELTQIGNTYSEAQQAEYLQALSILLRRVAISGFGRLFNPSLKGEDWLRWLDAQCKQTSNQFSEGVGRALLIGPYQKNPDIDKAALQALAQTWISQHRNQWQQSTPKHSEAPQHV